MKTIKDFKIVKYEEGGISIDVRYDIDSNTIWLTQSEIAFVFETTKKKYRNAYKNIVGRKSGFLPEAVEILVNNQTTKTYNLDTIEEIYKHLKSTSSYVFIKWADDLINNGFDNQMSRLSLYKDNIYDENELEKMATVQKFWTVQIEEKQRFAKC